MTPMKTREVVVRSRREVASDVVELTLAAPDSGPLDEWAPGAHVEFVLAPNLIRQYSLCGNPHERESWTIAVLREHGGRGGSDFIHGQVKVGSRLAVQAMRNQFRFDLAPSYVFIAGGIGVTPLRPMIAEAHRAGAEWRLIYGGRTRLAMAYAEELENRYGERVLIQPQDEAGLLHIPAAIGPPRADALIYSCGPEGLLAAVESACAAWPSGALRIERFTAGALAADATLDGASFEVELARDGRIIQIPPDATILDALEAAGVDVLSSCREGICGTCETSVMDGAVDHRDFYMTDDERAAGDTMMICVSRAAGPRLVLDL
jgi:ferredoxin-NADP reductase